MHRSLKDKRIWEDVAEPVQEAKVTDVFSEDAYRHSTTQTRRKFTTIDEEAPTSDNEKEKKIWFYAHFSACKYDTLEKRLDTLALMLAPAPGKGRTF